MATRKLPIYAGLVANLVIAATKFIAASASGSSAMVSEGIHSVVDTANEALLLLGIKKSSKPPDAKRPFGYGKELYFWSFIVSLLIFAIGGGLSFYEGITYIRRPEAIKDPFWNYIVLIVAFVFEGITFILALKAFNKQRGETPFWQAVRRSKDPTTFVVLFEDGAGLLGLLIAFAGVYLGHLYKAPIADGIASIAIGLLLTGISLMLARESRSLLMGETASPTVLEEVMNIAKSDPAIIKVNYPLSMYLGPEEIVLVLEAKFKDGLATSEIVAAINHVRQSIQTKYPRFKRIVIQPIG
jgi:cation diffusion facilitator family transporter